MKNSENVAEKILKLINENEMKPGSQLPAINKMAEDFMVSNGTMREALMRLSALGLVDVQHGKGIFIAEPDGADLFRSIAWRPIIERVGVSEVMEARIAVESMTSSLAAERARPENLAEMDVLIARMETALTNNEPDLFLELDGKFHDAIGRSSENRLLAGFVIILREIILFARKKPLSKEALTTSLNYHKQIARAIREKAAEHAGELTKNHIRTLEEQNYNQGIEIHCDGLGTGSLGGSFYTMGQFIAREIARTTWIKPVVYVTGGGIDNVRLIQEKHTVLSITQAETAANAFYGRGEFESAYSDLRVLCCLPGLTLQIATLSSQNITSLYDLKGKSIALGAHGGAGAIITKKILETCGLSQNNDYTSLTLPLPTAVELMNKNQIHAVSFLSAGPSAAFLELAGSKPLKMLSLDENLIESFVSENPFWYRDTLAPHTYPDQAETVLTIGTPTILVTHKDLPDKDAYAISSAILDRITEISALTMSEPPPSGKGGNGGLPFHPGARRENSFL